MSKVSIIIPFYQRKRDLLKNALQSVLAQTAYEQIEEIIVIDDGSPIPAEGEIANFSSEQMEKIKLIKQENGGVSNARNNGINLVSEHCEFVAFLDPDDIWLPEHIEYSLVGLRSGSDFHFSNFTHIGQKVGAFERANYLSINEHPTLAGCEDIYTYQGDITHQITTANVIGTTSVVYRFSKFPDARFDENFTFAGEDYLMWLQLTASNPKITFTAKITAHCGEGINLFSGAEWATEHLANRLFDEIQFRSYLLETVEFKPETKAIIEQKLEDNKQAYGRNFRSMIKKLNFSALWLLINHMKTLPFLWRYAIGIQ